MKCKAASHDPSRGRVLDDGGCWKRRIKRLLRNSPFSFCLPGDWVNFEDNKSKVMKSERATTKLKRLKNGKIKSGSALEFPTHIL